MKEINYFGKTFMKPFPKLQKNGAISAVGGEPMPFIYKGQMFLLESRNSKSTFSIKNYFTGEMICTFGGDGYHFFCAYCENDVVYIYGTSENRVYRYVTTDLKTFTGSVVLVMPENFELFNTSVCKAEDKYVMAIECAWAGLTKGKKDDGSNPYIGKFFTEFFAESPDLEHWTLLPLEKSYTKERYIACPDLHYCDGYYYMVCLEELPLTRYAPYMYRTKDFENWEMGMCNPIFIASEEDRHTKPGMTLPADIEEKNAHGVIINVSDVGMCEFEGKTYITYVGGDQGNSWSGLVCEAVYDGPLNEYLQANFS